MDNPQDSKKTFFDGLHSVYEGDLDSDEDEDGLFRLPFKKPPCDTSRSPILAARPSPSRTQSAPTPRAPEPAKPLEDKVGSTLVLSEPTSGGSRKVQPARRGKSVGSTPSVPAIPSNDGAGNTPIHAEPTTVGSVKVRASRRVKTVAPSRDAVEEVDKPVKRKGKERAKPVHLKGRSESQKPNEQSKAKDPKAVSTPEAEPGTKLRLPDSLRFVVHDKKALGKKKPPSPIRRSDLFDGLYFYFVPNNLNGPARKFRIQRASEHGAFCLNEWRADAVTHIVVDSSYNWSQLLTMVNAEIPDNVVIVKENYPGDCMQYRRILDHAQDMYQIPGREPEPVEVPSESPESLQIKEKNRIQETQRIHEESPPRDIRDETPPRSSPQKRKRQDDSDSELCRGDSKRQSQPAQRPGHVGGRED